MNAIRKGDKGTAVKAWQFFLVGLGYSKVIADGNFGSITQAATIDFQKSHGVAADGVVGNGTYSKAMQFGFQIIDDPKNDSESGPNWPPPPNFKPHTPTQVQSTFGKIEFKINPDGNGITITNNWQAENIIYVEIPQIKNLPPYYSKKIPLHKKAAPQFLKLFSEWEKAKLIDRLITYDGTYNPRLIRGSATVLSNHSFGAAIDLNAQWNSLGAMPPLVGQKGTLRELVAIANKLGFYWGGHFGRKDGMHFEVAKII